jgi:hypothetical protein
MKKHQSVLVGVICLCWLLVGTTGCQTDGGNLGGGSKNIKPQGVYTTLAAHNNGLDLSGAQYLQKTDFAPGERPAAVVAGYGDYNQPLSVHLELIELGTGRTLMSKDDYASYGKAMVHSLAIRLSGQYELKLSGGGVALDSCQFTVTRTNQSGMVGVDLAQAEAKYAEGGFWVGFEDAKMPEISDQYVSRLIYHMLNSVTKEVGSTNRDLFAQRFPGKVVVHCRLDASGQLSDPSIVSNELDDECAAVLAQALLDRSPYDAWPAEARQALGTDHCDINVVIRYQ